MKRLSLLYILIALILIVSCASNKPASPEDAAKAVKLQKEARKLVNIKTPIEAYRMHFSMPSDSSAIVLLESANALDPSNLSVAKDLSTLYLRSFYYDKCAKFSKKYLKKDTDGDFCNFYCQSEYNEVTNSDREFGLRFLLDKLKKYPDNVSLHITFSRYLDTPGQKVAYLSELYAKYPNSTEIILELYNILKYTDNVTQSFFICENFLLREDFSRLSELLSKDIYDNYSTLFIFDDSSSHINYSGVKIIVDQNSLKNMLDRRLVYLASIFGKKVNKTELSNKFEGYYKVAIRNINEFSFDNLVKIRKSFIHVYFLYAENKKSPDPLFVFHKELIDQNLFEAYNYWLFRYGIEEGDFNKWYTDHQNDYEKVEEIVKKKFRS